MVTFKKIGYISICLSLFHHSCRPVNSLQSRGPGLPGDSSALVNTAVLFRNDIPLKAARELMKRFGEAKHVDWQKTGTTGWVARFMIGSADTRIYFNPNGSWSSIWSSYAETPSDINRMIKKNFTGYTINDVHSVTFPWDSYNSIFSVLISTAANRKVIKIYKGNMTIFSDFDTPSLAEN